MKREKKVLLGYLALAFRLICAKKARMGLRPPCRTVGFNSVTYLLFTGL